MTSTRDALLDAGVRLIAEHGYRSVTVGQIEAGAGFTARGGTLYRHFRSKDELLVAAVDRHVESLADQHGLADLLPLPDLGSELRVIGRWVLGRLDAEETISRIVEKEGARLGPVVDRLRDGVSEPGYRLLAAFLEDRGLAPDDDVDAVAVVLLGGLVNLRRSAWTFGRPPAGIDDERAVEAWTATCLAVLGATDR